MSKTVEIGCGCGCHSCSTDNGMRNQAKVTMEVIEMEAGRARGTGC